MKLNRIVILVGIIFGSLCLLCVSLAIAQEQPDQSTPQPLNGRAHSEAAAEAEAAAEREAARQAELGIRQIPQSVQAVQGGFFSANTFLGNAPLFVGLDSFTEPAYRIDISSGTFYSAFVGAEVWSAAYDPMNDRVLFSGGVDLWEWPVGGTPQLLGNMIFNGGNVSIVGLAYHDGILYGSRNVGEEEIYVIDPVSLEATIAITLSLSEALVDLGGLAADPRTGQLYATNDDADMRGLVQIDPDGTVTWLAPYPGVEDDVDGLAISDGKAYLITDDNTPAYFHVFDLGVMTYTGVVSSPWTVSEIFAGGAWIGPPPLVPDIQLFPTAVTAAQLPDVAVDRSLQIYNEGEADLIWYLVEQENAGEFVGTRTWGSVAARPSPPLAQTPTGGCTPADIPWISVTPLSGTLPISSSQSITITFDSTGYGPGVYTASLCIESNDWLDPVVTVPLTMSVSGLPSASIILTKTVGMEMGVCAAESEITVEMGTAVNYCYQVMNNGGITLPFHTLTDTAFGNLLLDSPLALAPGQSTQLQVSTTLTTSTVNSATWTAFSPHNITTNDPVSDTFGTSSPQLDIQSISLATDGTALTIELSYTGPISPGDSGAPNALTGYIDLDTDLNQGSGTLASADVFCPNGGSLLGVDYFVNMFSYSSGTGQMDVLDENYLLAGTAVATFSQTSVTMVIPTGVLGDDDGIVRAAGVTGTWAEATDCVPNRGFVSNEPFTALATAAATVHVLIPDPTWLLYLPVTMKP